MVTKYIVNNLSGQTINDQQLLPYKVYTALLTQSGGDVPFGVAGDGEQIVLGITYEITDNPNNNDLTIYGAPNNNVGTFFVANQTTNLPYTNSLQLLGNTGAPVVTVLENTIGNIWFGYDTIGFYTISSNGLFSDDKTFFISALGPNGGDYQTPALLMLYRNDINTVQLITSNVNGNALNDCMLKTSIEIRVYN